MPPLTKAGLGSTVAFKKVVPTKGIAKKPAVAACGSTGESADLPPLVDTAAMQALIKSQQRGRAALVERHARESGKFVGFCGSNRQKDLMASDLTGNTQTRRVRSGVCARPCNACIQRGSSLWGKVAANRHMCVL